MKFGRLAVVSLVGASLLVLLMPKTAHAQVDVYGEFSASQVNGLNSSNNLYGATTGILYDGPTIFRHVVVSADIQGRFVQKNSEKLDGITIGPRFSFPVGHGFSPYAEFMLGFARYNNPNEGGATTDSTIQCNGGLAKQMSPRFDLVGDFSYSEYFALGGEYNPKTYSAGVVFHFVKREPLGFRARMTRRAALPAATKPLP